MPCFTSLPARTASHALTRLGFARHLSSSTTTKSPQATAPAPAPAPALDRSPLKLAQLRTLLAHIGRPTTGTKPALLARLRRGLALPVLPFDGHRLAQRAQKERQQQKEEEQQQQQQQQQTMRVLSIDMGIRNLAYCVVDVSLSPTKPEAVVLRIVEWQRVNVLAARGHTNQVDSEAQETPAKNITAAEAAEEEGEEEDEVEAYSPAQLAPAAVTLVSSVFLPARPHLIAIERQRFRSAGGSAVLEWTLRVNMLEGMLWAALKSALAAGAAAVSQHSREQEQPAVVGVSPARVARFWLPRVAGGKTAIEKKEKVAVVRRWLAGETPSGLSIAVDGDAALQTRELVMTGRLKGADKVDDLADCLLQAGALGVWERNRRVISGMSVDELQRYCEDAAADTG